MGAKKKTKRVRRAKPRIYREPEPLRLDLGSGPRPAEGFRGVDRAKVTDFCLDLTSGARWPWEDGSVDEFRSSHFIEHIPNVDLVNSLGLVQDALLCFFDEAFRIAKDGAVFTIQWPALKSERAFQDPTHRRFIPAPVINYLCREGRIAMGVEDQYNTVCNWIGSVTFTMSGPTPEEQKEAEQMALRADSSDEKQAYIARVQAEQGRRYRETWEYAGDFVATLRAVKSS